jgi:hypothetical protein
MSSVLASDTRERGRSESTVEEYVKGKVVGEVGALYWGLERA